VLTTRLRVAVDNQPTELVLGPVARRIDIELAEKFQTARAQAQAALESDRYFRLLDRLEAFVASPPLAPGAEKPARRILPRLLQRDWKRVQKRARAAAAAPDAGQRELALHEVRKAAKRLRYAAETARPVLGKRNKRLGALAKAVQQALGELQDTVVSRHALREIGVRAHLNGENGYTFGRLHALEEAHAGDLVAKSPALLAQFPKKKLDRWLSR
jgi:CHAD domain-containing protein